MKLLDYNRKLKKYSQELRNNQTYAEKIVWNLLRGDRYKGIRFNRQKPLGNFIYDFYSAKLKLVIEIDGDIHEEEQQQNIDFIKNKYAESQGLKILRFTNEEVIEDVNIVTKRLEEYICNLEGIIE